MTNEFKNTPADTLRDGALKATIWKNEGESGPYYTVNFSRTYTDKTDGSIKSSDSFTGSELLRVSHLAPKVYDRIAMLRQADKAEMQ